MNDISDTAGRIVERVENAPVFMGIGRPATPHSGDAAPDPYDDNEAPSGKGAEGVEPEIISGCAGLDHSDTDNAERMIRYFGRDLAILAQDGVAGGDWLAWAGTHWDIAGGTARSWTTASRVGDLIGLEADHLTATITERRSIEAGETARLERDALDRTSEKRTGETVTAADKTAAAERGRLTLLIAEAEAAKGELQKRKLARRRFGVSSKNKARIAAMLECAAPRLRRPADSFNCDRLRVACASHTLAFSRNIDLECPDPDVERWQSEVDAIPQHRREDWITAVIPIKWKGIEAGAPNWRRFIADMHPDEARRRTLQQYAGLGLLGTPVQFMMFHYGLGANGKSVFLETLTRVLGPGLAVGLPRESVVGSGERSAGGASPDLVRLYGKRMVRILEVKGDAPLQEDLIKKLTGGEAFPVRTLFKGYFEFQSIATPHMSGNGFPTIDGTDNGIWRRLLVMHWDQVIPEEKRRDLEDVVSEFVRDEGPGILAWLVEGALDYLANGLVIAPSVQAATKDYREEMDPIGEFVSACVRRTDGGRVQAHSMYEAYVSWSMANAKRARTNTKFGRTLAQRWHKTEVGGRLYYTDCELHDVPQRPDQPRNPAPDDLYPG